MSVVSKFSFDGQRVPQEPAILLQEPAFRHEPYDPQNCKRYDIVHRYLVGKLLFIPYAPSIFSSRLFGTLGGYVVDDSLERLYDAHNEELYIKNFWTSLPSSVLAQLSCFDDPATQVRLFNWRPHTVVSYREDLNGVEWLSGAAYVTACSPQGAGYFAAKFSGRILFDKSGMWYAATNAEMIHLHQYTAALAMRDQDARHRFLQGLPCRPLLIEPRRSFPRHYGY